MPLPKIATPTYELVLPSSDRKIKYRPFLVKEEKILIIAMESEDQKQITNAIKSVINNCILSRGIKVDKLSTFDIEYLFLNIRGKSVGENVEVVVTCPDDNETEVSVIIPLDEIKININPDHNKDIKLDDNLVMRMRYPSLSEFVKTNFDSDDEITVDQSFDLIISCIDQIFNEEESWNASDCTKKEMTDFLEQLSSKQFKEVEKFFDTMPKLSHTIKVTNPKTKVKNEVLLEGLSSFFE
tara:strand:- start:4210 stop:4929 length:720 start_codon:yes stop_codon:yes gene_type:complete